MYILVVLGMRGVAASYALSFRSRIRSRRCRATDPGATCFRGELDRVALGGKRAARAGDALHSKGSGFIRQRRNVVLAWDASASAARAVGDTIPILKRAKSVEIVHPQTLIGDIISVPELRQAEFTLTDVSGHNLELVQRIVERMIDVKAERGLSYLFTSRDLKVVRSMCHRVIVMQHGKIVEQGSVKQVLSAPQTDYTRRLVRAALDIAA